MEVQLAGYVSAWGEIPSLRAASSTMGLKELPGWRLAARAKLNSPSWPARALMAPVWGSTVTTSDGRVVVRIRQYVLGGFDSRVLEVGVERRVDPEFPRCRACGPSSSTS